MGYVYSIQTFVWNYLEHLCLILRFTFLEDGNNGEKEDGSHNTRWKKVGVKEIKEVRDNEKVNGSDLDPVSILMESLSSSGELSDICWDTSLSVERLSDHIVQQTLIRQPCPPPCALISIARGCGNPRQGPAENLITAIASSSLNPYCRLPS